MGNNIFSGKMKKIRTEENMSKAQKGALEINPEQGYNNKNLVEPIPHYVKAKCERVIKGKNNTYIVLGRDRMGSLADGYGGIGAMRAGAIDIVVGRSGATEKGPVNGSNIHSNPRADAARIYISQKADIDTYFDTKGARPSSARSAIAVKADQLRLIAREEINLITMPPQSERLSSGELIRSQSGINLNAGNKNTTFLQPIVMGDNLLELLKETLDIIDDLTESVNTFMTAQQRINVDAGIHIHDACAGFGAPSSPSTGLLSSVMEQTPEQLIKAQIKSTINVRYGILRLEQNYLVKHGGDVTIPANKYINSKHNRTN